ncbi:DUF4344 domain-containing metallopeptidase [Pseudomonas sp. GWSMS-1]|uniref:DUF4344 domain-containing metallopeptidase n=1 Tax=Pseudomonas sp. GWSMS-1 TaxID=3308997 RepID=UPI003CF0E6C0
MKRLVLLLLSFNSFAQAVPEQVLHPNEVRFVTANAEFTLLHEMGHLLISELQLPVLGREEDAADQLGFMGLFLLHGRHRDADFYAKLLDVADYWRLEWQRQRPDAPEIHEWDSHALDAQRFFNLACLAYGSDPRQLEWVIQMTGLPDERAFYCPEEYQQAEYAVNWIRQHFARSPDQPILHHLRVEYQPPPQHLPGASELLEKVRASGELEAIAARTSSTFALPRDLKLIVAACGEADAWYNRISGELTLCYERILYFRELARELPRLRQPFLQDSRSK